MGVLQHIGIKNIRLRSLSGDVIVMSNKYLTDSQVQNYKLLERRRNVHLFEIEGSTLNLTLRELPGLVKSMIAGLQGVTFDRCYFKDFGGSGLVFETIFYFESPDYTVFMERRQDLNFTLKFGIEDLGIGFAFPNAFQWPFFQCLASGWYIR